MKELLEFENWASNVIDSTLLERDNKKDSGDAIKRELPKEQDIVFQAQRKYPDRPADQALNLYLADKLDDFEKRDLQQNQVINSQRRENEKLNTNLSSLQKEFQSIENTGKTTQSEIERLKQLSGQLKGDVEKRRVDTSEVQNLLAKVEQLQSKPGVNSEQYEQLKKQVQDFATKQVDPKKFAEFSDKIDRMSAQERISSENFEELQQSIADLEAKQIAGTELKGSLEQKIQRLSKEQETETAALQQKIEDLEERTPIVDMENLKLVQDKILQKEQELLDISNKIKQEKQAWRQDPEAQKYRQRVGRRSKQASTLIKNFLGKEFPKYKALKGMEDEGQNKSLDSLRELMLDLINNEPVSPADVPPPPDEIKKSAENNLDLFPNDSENTQNDDFETADDSEFSDELDFDEYSNQIKPSSATDDDSDFKDVNMNKLKQAGSLTEDEKKVSDNGEIEYTTEDWIERFNKLRNTSGQTEMLKKIIETSKFFWNELLSPDERASLMRITSPSNQVILKESLNALSYFIISVLVPIWEENNLRSETVIRKYSTHFFMDLLASVKRIEKKRARLREPKYQMSMFEYDDRNDESIEEAANKMVDNIIGEQVARWIK
jgi:hypothetical protein